MIQNLLVTGGAGFIGSNLIRFLLEESNFKGRIYNLDKLTYAGNLENLTSFAQRFPDRYTFIQADIADLSSVTTIFADHPIDAVCHLAAESHVDRSILRPDDFIRTNIVGTFNLLELARMNQHRMVRFHHVSTDEVFGSLDNGGYFTETTPYQPNSPYSASKASSDHLVRAYHKTYGLNVTISNCSNNYGPYQFPEKLLPLMILNALQDKALPVYGDGQQVRDWLFVRDHCRAIWEILQRGKNGETYNVGGNTQIPNLKIIEILCEILQALRPRSDGKKYFDLVSYVKDRPGHDRRYAIDFSKIENELGWRPEESLDSGLEKTIQWYLKNPDWVSRVQSGEYQNWINKHYAKAI